MLLYDRMFELGLTPVIQTYTSLIQYCIQHGDPRNVKYFLDSMKQHNIHFDNIIYSMIITAYSKTVIYTLIFLLICEKVQFF